MDTEDFESAGLLEGLDEPAREARIELLRDLAEQGFTPDELVEAARDQRLALLPVDRVFDREGAKYTPAELAERSGLDVDFLRRLWRALGMAEVEDDEVAFGEADLEAATTVAQFNAVGLPEDALVLVSQVLGQESARLAETLREITAEAMLEAGISERTLGLRFAQAAEQLVPMLAPLRGYILDVHLREQVKTDIVSQAELQTGRLEGARHVTVCFADLVGFTRLGERVPPAELSHAGRRLTEVAVEAARPPVRLVKMVGDGALLVSPEPEPLVEAGLELCRLAESHDDELPPLRVGLADGPAIPQSGDWFGAPVNLASRVTEVARPGSVLVTRAVRDAVHDSFAWSYAGKKRFRGVSGEVALYRARPKEPVSPAK
ncbi:MAG TPA: adenylate cyclase regulatory domain-containing protein [Thermoleophilaceae bacterium]|nr:adenylate cyclase regulatory domain-containing protein [Thermoleophilaceae bacterium]